VKIPLRAVRRPIRVQEVTHDFALQLHVLENPEPYFGIVPLWTDLTGEEKSRVVDELRRIATRDGDNGVLRIPSTALMAVGER
jgi:hypothetical protein